MTDNLMALLIGLGVVAVFLVWFWPKKGIRSWWKRRVRQSARMLGEDALKFIHESVACNHEVSLQSVANKLHVSAERAKALLEILHEQGLLHVEGSYLKLTPSGERYALHIIRAHRLWEHYLAEETGFPETEWHGLAEKREHFLEPDEAHALSAQLGHPTHDPHGDPIPTHEGELIDTGGEPLSAVPPGTLARVVHIEDEPDCVYAQLVDEGLYPGMEVRTLEVDRDGVRFTAEGIEHQLTQLLAANVFVVPQDRLAEEVQLGEPLSRLQPDSIGVVLGLSRRCRGAERRRMLDLGILPGTLIEAEMVSPSGDPTAYNIRDALIALRKEQADLIRIRIHDKNHGVDRQKQPMTGASTSAGS
jgi:DtxR family Mn-dependent transcriptional regulator